MSRCSVLYLELLQEGSKVPVFEGLEFSRDFLNKRFNDNLRKIFTKEFKELKILTL